MSVCRRCNAPIEHRSGRGRQPLYCSDACREAAGATERQERVLAQLRAQMLEFALTFAPTIEKWRADIEMHQGGACAQCRKNHRRLFLEHDDAGSLVAKCVDCFDPHVHPYYERKAPA